MDLQKKKNLQILNLDKEVSISVLVIGSESFLGKSLIEDLMAQSNIQLSVAFRNATDEKIQFYLQNKIEVYQGDLVQEETLSQMEKSFDYVYYLVSATYPANSWKNPWEEVSLNLTPFFNLLKYLEEFPPKKVIYISSAGTVYGLKTTSLDENKLTRPFSPYGIFKVTMEHLLEYLRVKKGIAYDIYRVSNLYGPGQNPLKGQGVINIWVRKIIEEGKIVVFGDGSNVRDYIYVKDASMLLTHSLKPNVEDSQGCIYNLGTNEGFDLNQIIEILREVMPYTFDVDYRPNRKSDNKHVVVDSSKLNSNVPGFKFNSLKAGIQSTVDYMLEEHKLIKRQLS